MPLLPYVRRELFLQAIKNRDASALPDPNNREELFLKAIAEETALIPSGVSVVLPAEVSEMLANLPEAHTHTERFYRDIIDAMLIATTVTDTTPYISRETAGGLPVSGTANLKKKLGNTVAVNQLVDTATTSVTIPSGHKYYAVINGTASIGTSNGSAIAVTGGQDIVIDLTLWFGSNDRIPSDLFSHPENWGRYYAGSLDYNAGTLESADGTVLTSKGADGTTVIAEVDTGSEVLRSAGAVADEKTPDGTITRRCYEVTYDGSNDENWTAETIVSITTTDKNFYISVPLSKKAVTVRTNRFVSYAVGNAYLVAGQPNAFVSGGGNLNVYFNQGLTDVSALRAYLSSNPLTVICELATPTTEQGTAFDPEYAVEAGGTESWTNLKGIPQGHETEYTEYTT